MHPDHVKHVLRDHPENYVREGPTWRPFRKLGGDGIGGEGESWALSRGILHSVLAGRHVNPLLDEMALAIGDAVADLERRTADGRPVDAELEMTRIVQRAVIRTFFASKISVADGDRLAQAIATATHSLQLRSMLSFVPERVPMPGDRTFRRSVRTVDEIVYPLVEDSKRTAAGGTDLLSLLRRARDPQGRALSDKQIRDDVAAMFAASLESTATALTWLWVVLHDRPDVAARLHEEIDRVVGTGNPERSHLPQLTYTRLLVQELVRIYAVAWLIPRSVVKDDVIGGTPIKGGSVVLTSPYLSHRMGSVWNRPGFFDPERFAAGPGLAHTRSAYLAFGSGPHTCLGINMFQMEAQLIIAALLSRFRPVLKTEGPISAQAGVTLRPSPAIRLVMAPAHRHQAA